jgi:flagellar biosynthetic protein FlhB
VAVGPIFLVTFVVAIVVEVAQTGGLLFTMTPLEPNLSKLNPLEGFKKIFFSLKGLVELAKSLIKIFIVLWIIYIAIKNDLWVIVSTCNLDLWSTMKLTANIVYKVAMRVGMFYFVVALFDYMYQRFEFLKGLRMSKQEIKEEYKRLEGDPQIKQRIRTAQREMAQRRMMGAVPGADVVVTNPVHLAVALKYDVKVMKAPEVIAKGMRLIAERIKAIAEENRVPIVENQALAQSLYRTTQINQEIPLELYKAVAELLAFVYNLEKKRKKRH